MTPITVEVLMDDHAIGSRRPNGKRKVVTATLVKRNAHTVWVRLASGRVIQRRIDRDVPSLVNDFVGEVQL